MIKPNGKLIPVVTQPGRTAAKPQSDLGNATALFAFLSLILGATALAFGGVLVRESELEPTASAVYRVALAIPLFFLLDRMLTGKSGAMQVDSSSTPAGPWRQLIPIGFIFSGNLALYHWSMTLTTLANSNLLANLAPIFVVIGGRILFGHRFSKGFICGMVTALIGAAVLISARLDPTSSYFIGNILGVVTGMFYGAYLLAVSRVRSKFSTMSVMAWSSVGTFVVLLPITIMRGEDLIPQTLYGVAILVGLALISHVAGQGLIAYALAKLPAGLSSVTLLIQPVIATAIGWFLLGEQLQVAEYLGGAIVLAGIAMSKRLA